MPRIRIQFPATLDLSTLTPKQGFTISGVTMGDQSGWSVNYAGDVNADGINDFIVGAIGANNHAGASYVVFGSHGIGRSGTLSLSNLNGFNGFKVAGVTPGDASGWSVSSAGDVNADGITDLIIGAPQINSGSGTSYVVFGAHGIGSSGNLSLFNLNGSNGFNITGVTANDWSGYAVSSAGDLNADGIDDLIIGAPQVNGGAGASYVVFGAHGIGRSGSLSLANLTGSNGFKVSGVTLAGNSGISISSAGDVNADGINDLIVGAYGVNSYAGASYVVFGAHGLGSSGIVSLANLTGSNGFNITSVAPGDRYGYSVSSAGDVNADGIADHGCRIKI